MLRRAAEVAHKSLTRCATSLGLQAGAG
ncbi:hypothetical protein LVC68_15665 [Melaminivora jejuensis]|nr:hypothetical protein [Melaminivora jejuensis]UHJ66682.1 hypothetical protein LVC68_15665 [Melaminivora jejuensis]